MDPRRTVGSYIKKPIAIDALAMGKGFTLKEGMVQRKISR